MTTDRQRQVAAAVRADQQFWRSLVAEVGRDRMLEPGPMGEWTFKDLTAHLAVWRNARIPMIEAVGRGEALPPAPWPAELKEDVDAINVWTRERDRDRSLDDVLADYDRSFERLAAALEALPESTAHDPVALPWAEGTPAVDIDFTEHLHEEHVPAIRAWLSTASTN
jgi:hypothetical protein